jgi:hypothetical protein
MNLGFVENRKIKYLKTHSKNWEEHLPKRKWVALILNHAISLSELFSIYEICKKQNALSICFLSDSNINLTIKSAEEYTDLILEFIKNNQLEAMDQYLELAHKPFFENETEAFYFASKLAALDFENLLEEPDNITVVCLDTRRDTSFFSILQQLITSKKC